nr:MAG TPA: hypothetical protein [Caudoviricetes sp.]
MKPVKNGFLLFKSLNKFKKDWLKRKQESYSVSFYLHESKRLILSLSHFCSARPVRLVKT